MFAHAGPLEAACSRNGLMSEFHFPCVSLPTIEFLVSSIRLRTFVQMPMFGVSERNGETLGNVQNLHFSLGAYSARPLLQSPPPPSGV